MHEKPLRLGHKYLIKHGARTSKVIFREIVHKLDVHTLEDLRGGEDLRLNEIARVRFSSLTPLVYDAYKKNRNIGGFVIIDEAGNDTLAAGMLRSPDKPPPLPEFTDYMI